VNMTKLEEVRAVYAARKECLGPVMALTYAGDLASRSRALDTITTGTVYPEKRLEQER